MSNKLELPPTGSSQSEILGDPARIEADANSAPLWLTQRMDALLETPPPTLEEVRTQFKASMEVRQKSIDKAGF